MAEYFPGSGSEQVCQEVMCVGLSSPDFLRTSPVKIEVIF